LKRTESGREEVEMRTPATAASCSESINSVGYDFSLAYLLLRMTLGVNIVMHGLSRILVGVGFFTAALEKQFAATPLPHFAVRAFGNALPCAEMLIGLLVLVGGMTRIALVAGALLILLLTFGSTLHQDWEVAGLQLIYAIVYSLLIAFGKFNSISLDRLLGVFRFVPGRW
jgi:thiosulfate dehydrogenase [quinone] large subunit